MRAPVHPSVARLPVIAALLAAAACADQPTAPDPIAAAPTGARFSTAGVPTTAVYNPANGHSYELIAVPAGSRWHEANLEATLRGGYLATITSQAEQDFLLAMAGRTYRGIYWLGGYQDAGSAEPSGGWRWRTTEPWGYTRWMAGEPNNFGGAEDHLSIYLFGSAHADNGKWNDRHLWLRIQGYVVEYEPDASAPVVTPTVTGTEGQDGWYVSDVSVAWTVADEQTPTVVVSGCEGGAVTADTGGASFACEAASGGGRTSGAVTVKRDATAPVVTFSGNAGSYTVDQTVAITCAASDPAPGSGLESGDCAGVAGPAYQFGPGSYSFAATATDRAGNQGRTAGEFQVTVSAASLCTLVQRFVSNRGIANALCQKLDNAMRGNQQSKAGQLGAFVNQVQAQSGKALTEEQAAILIRLVAAL